MNSDPASSKESARWENDSSKWNQRSISEWFSGKPSTPEKAAVNA